MSRVRSKAARRPDPPPLETDDVAVVLAGTALWAVALVVLLVLRVADVTRVPDWWLGMCAYGVALGLYGARYCRRRHRAITARAAAAAAAHPPVP